MVRNMASQAIQPALPPGTFMRVLMILVAVVSGIALTACGVSADGPGQPHRNQAGPYIGGGAGVGF
jgi:hypothetical protein